MSLHDLGVMQDMGQFRKAIAEFEKDVSCCVCFELFDNPMMLHCEHTLCEKCICQMQDINMSKCPTCRRDIQFHNITNDLHMSKSVDKFRNNMRKCFMDQRDGNLNYARAATPSAPPVEQDLGGLQRHQCPRLERVKSVKNRTTKERPNTFSTLNGGQLVAVYAKEPMTVGAGQEVACRVGRVARHSMENCSGLARVTHNGKPVGYVVVSTDTYYNVMYFSQTGRFERYQFDSTKNNSKHSFSSVAATASGCTIAALCFGENKIYVMKCSDRYQLDEDCQPLTVLKIIQLPPHYRCDVTASVQVLGDNICVFNGSAVKKYSLGGIALDSVTYSAKSCGERHPKLAVVGDCLAIIDPNQRHPQYFDTHSRQFRHMKIDCVPAGKQVVNMVTVTSKRTQVWVMFQDDNNNDNVTCVACVLS